MSDGSEAHKIRAFISRYSGSELLSTGAELVEFAEVLYNVTGSTEDPRAIDGHRGVSWKALLNRFDDFLDASCYVTRPEAEARSNHPQFSVGGHMTPDSSGLVDVGGASYLMPLCKWHNSTARDGVPFHHRETRMLRLTGFMEGDTPLTFALRLPGDDDRTLLYFDAHRQTWETVGAEDVEVYRARFAQPLARPEGRDPVEYAVFERQGDRVRIVTSNVIMP